MSSDAGPVSFALLLLPEWRSEARARRPSQRPQVRRGRQQPQPSPRTTPLPRPGSPASTEKGAHPGGGGGSGGSRPSHPTRRRRWWWWRWRRRKAQRKGKGRTEAARAAAPVPSGCAGARREARYFSLQIGSLQGLAATRKCTLAQRAAKGAGQGRHSPAQPHATLEALGRRGGPEAGAGDSTRPRFPSSSAPSTWGPPRGETRAPAGLAAVPRVAPAR